MRILTLLALLLVALDVRADPPPCAAKPLPPVRASSRNIFAFPREPVAVPRRIAMPQTVQPAIVIAPIALPQAAPAPRFTFRYIGRFGPDANPIAAFTRDGEVRLARIGETIDTHFVLRTIGIESVELELRPGGSAQRIGVGD